MSDPQSTLHPNSAFEPFDYQKNQQGGLDFLSFQPSDILAPHPDLFESELDSNLADFDAVQLQLLTVDSNDAFSYFREPDAVGPESVFSASDYSSHHSSHHPQSLYNYSDVAYSEPNPSFPFDLEMDFRRINVDNVSDYGVNSQQQPTTVDPHSFGALPPTPPRSPPVASAVAHRSSVSDYGGVRPSRSGSAAAADYYAQLNYGTGVGTVSPSHVSSQLPTTHTVPHGARSLRGVDEESKDDSRKKYRCNACPRAFARAYNLKTHMATHDPNRLKPHVCPHTSCGRSFSRKHDLGRHLVSIHRDESLASSHHSGSTRKSIGSIGVEQGRRGWCDSCGKGWIGAARDCECNDIK